MFDPLDKDKKRKVWPLMFTVNISYYIIIFSDENDTNEVKGSCHDDCLEKERERERKKKKHILHIELGNGS